MVDNDEVAFAKLLVVICLPLFLGFSIWDYVGYFTTARQDLRVVVGQVALVECRYPPWLKTLTKTDPDIKITLEHEEALYWTYSSPVNCTRYDQTISTTSKLRMLVTSSDEIADLVADGTMVFTYDQWRREKLEECLVDLLLVVVIVWFGIVTFKKK